MTIYRDLPLQKTLTKHKRQIIREQICIALKDKTDAHDRVYPNKTTNYLDENLPEITIFSENESITELGEAPRVYKRELNILVEAAAAGSNDAELSNNLDCLADQIERVLFKLASEIRTKEVLNCVIEDLMPNGVSFEFEGAGSQPIGVVRTSFIATYLTDEVLDNFDLPDLKNVISDWNFPPIDEQVEAVDKITFEE